MREEMLHFKSQVIHLKKMYASELDTNRKMQKHLKQIQNEKQDIYSKYLHLKSKLSKYEVKYSTSDYRKKKNWTEIQSVRTKYRRLNEYKNDILSTLKENTACHRAEITLWIHDRQAHFSFSPKQITQKMPNSTLLSIYQDHTYTRHDTDFDEESTYNDINYSEIFDCEGNWKSKHVRKLVHVMDNFKISQQAYHEIRMVSKGHLPSLYKISLEKKIMTEEIPYTKHPKVRKLYLVQ